MNPIDLVDYTHSKKIPTTFLKHAPASKTEIKSWKILAAHFIDFMMVMGATFMISGFLKLSFQNFMFGQHLFRAYQTIPFQTLSMSMMPLMLMSYFFFSYFFNHGQSFGMNTMKVRVEMNEQSFRSSFVWAIFSSSIIISWGLSYLWGHKFMQKNKWGNVKTHDHLYEGLMVERNLSPVNLVEMTLVPLPIDEEKEETYLEAA